MKVWISLLMAVLLVTACKPKSKYNGNKMEEKNMLVLGGEKQYVEITAESDEAPVLLFIHGGPGWPKHLSCGILTAICQNVLYWCRGISGVAVNRI